MARRLGLVLAMLPSLALVGPGCEHKTVTAPALAATCGANPANGPAPLAVAFTLGVSGAEGAFSVAIDYGDGAQGSDADKPHLYGAPGSYTPSFTVTTPTQSARCSAVVTVSGVVPTPTPPPSANQPPQTDFRTEPGASQGRIDGAAPLTVHFNMCRTVDPDGDAVIFKMDLDGDGVFEVEGSTGADCRRDATYGAGTRLATNCVTDVDCSSWPACRGTATLHPYQCRTYTIVVGP